MIKNERADQVAPVSFPNKDNAINSNFILVFPTP